jgi:SAM-dependent methyltransferase
MTHAAHAPDDPRASEEYWEDFYATGQARWSGRPNGTLVTEVADLSPGRALDLGCGQGGDAIWLAQQGWTVTATDIAASALELGARNAAAAGVGEAITWERHDLDVSLPDGPFDLVSAFFLHSKVPLDRTAILRAAAARVAPGGTLLVVGHVPSPQHPHIELPTPAEVLADLALPEDDWRVVRCEEVETTHAFAGEDPISRVDGVLRLVRTR